jgi:hypothetical protein
MQLSKKAIEDYKRIFLEESGKLLSDEEANRQGVQLLKLMKLVYKPIPIANRSQK